MKFEAATDDELVEASELITQAILAQTRNEHMVARRELARAAKNAAARGACLHLSDESTQLGVRMAQANAIGRERGWL